MQVETMRQPKELRRREPDGRVRTCVGCRSGIARDDEDASFRVVLGSARADGLREVAVDLAGGSFGRGAHVHASRACIDKACAAGLSRAFRCGVAAEPGAVARDVALAADRRVQGLLLGARRAGLLSFGEDARRAIEAGAPLVIVARDAGQSALGGPVGAAIAGGRALAWETKEELGRLFGRELVAIVAVRHEVVARRIRGAARLAEAVTG